MKLEYIDITNGFQAYISRPELFGLSRTHFSWSNFRGSLQNPLFLMI